MPGKTEDEKKENEEKKERKSYKDLSEAEIEERRDRIYIYCGRPTPRQRKE